MMDVGDSDDEPVLDEQRSNFGRRALNAAGKRKVHPATVQWAAPSRTQRKKKFIQYSPPQPCQPHQLNVNWNGGSSQRQIF